MPDFTVPGSDGLLPSDFVEFQRGIICSVHPRILAPLVPGQTYTILVSSRIRVAAGERVTSYAPWYRRARSLVRARSAELRCAAGGALETRIVSHGWFGMEITGGSLVGAAVTAAVACPIDGQEWPAAVRDPSDEELRLANVAQLAAVTDRGDWARWDEFVNEFRLGSDTGPIETFSYGEYVPRCEGLDFAPIVERAERRARRHFESLEQTAEGTFRILRRDWTCLETGKHERPWLAHVNVYFAV